MKVLNPVRDDDANKRKIISFHGEASFDGTVPMPLRACYRLVVSVCV